MCPTFKTLNASAYVMYRYLNSANLDVKQNGIIQKKGGGRFKVRANKTFV